MPTVVGVKFPRATTTLYFDPAGTTPQAGDHVIVETERGTEIGRVTEAPYDAEPADVPGQLKPIKRVADEQDLARAEELHAKEREAKPVFRQLINERKLDMKPVDVEFLFDGDKIVFYFSAEERVDFRDLVRDLASRYHARIDMRQVGVRDEARIVGGIGHCGEELCCGRFGSDFQPVSIRMAKEQDLPLNPLKISGLCGRLMCCLRYEYDAYKDYKSRAPKRGAMISMPQGEAKVVDLNTPKETVTLRGEDGKNLTVPLAMMDCKTGAGCPCMVKREALEELERATHGALLDIEEIVSGPAREPVGGGSGSGESASRSKRRRRPRDSSGEQPQGGQPKQAGGPKQGNKKPTDSGKRGGKPQAAPKPQVGGERPEAASPEAQAPPSRRRRRRRRPSGGNGNGNEQGAQ